VYAQQN
jgi:hypothetical protein